MEKIILGKNGENWGVLEVEPFEATEDGANLLMA
jgi:hypothetical protein